MPKLIEDHTDRRRRSTDEAIGGLFLVSVIIALIAGMFIGIEIEHRMAMAAQQQISAK